MEKLQADIRKQIQTINVRKQEVTRLRREISRLNISVSNITIGVPINRCQHSGFRIGFLNDGSIDVEIEELYYLHIMNRIDVRQRKFSDETQTSTRSSSASIG